MFFIPPGSDLEKFREFDIEYFQTGFNIEVMTIDPDIDFTSEETQYKLIEFWDKL